MKTQIGMAAAAAVLAAAVVGFARPSSAARAEGGGLVVISEGGSTTVFTASEDGTKLYVWRANHMPAVEGQRAAWTLERVEAGASMLTVTRIR